MPRIITEILKKTFDKSKSPAGWAQYVKDIVYKL